MNSKKTRVFLFSTLVLQTVFSAGYSVAATETSTQPVDTASLVAPSGDASSSDSQAPSGDASSSDSQAPSGDASGSDSQAPSGDASSSDSQAAEGEALAGVQAPAPAEGQGSTADQAPGAFAPSDVSSFEWKEVRGQITITGYTGQDSEVVIPDTINGKKVVVIGPYAFSRKNLTRVTIPGTVTHIQEDAFSENSLTSLELPAGLEWIGAFAFQSNKLTSVTFPTGLRMIDSHAFAHNNLTSIRIPEGIAEIRPRSFTSNPNLTDITLPSTLRKIGYEAFDRHENNTPATLSGNLVLPAGLKVIEERAFGNLPLASIFVPDSVTEIGHSAFYVKRAVSTTVPTVSLPAHLKGKVRPRTSLHPTDQSKRDIPLATYTFRETTAPAPTPAKPAVDPAIAANFDYKVKGAGIEIVRYKGDASEVVIPDTIEGKPVTVIGRAAFIPAGTTVNTEYGYLENESDGSYTDVTRNLTKVTIPATVTHIHGYAFFKNNLTSVNLPAGLKWIGSGAFAFNQLTQINLPSSLTMIDTGAFRANQLTSAVIPEGMTEIRNGVFSNNKLTSVTLPSSLKKIGRLAFSSDDYSSTKYATLRGSLTLPAGLKEIGDQAFGNQPLTSVYVPDSVTTVGTFAFYSEHDLSVRPEVSLPSHLKGKVIIKGQYSDAYRRRGDAKALRANYTFREDSKEVDAATAAVDFDWKEVNGRITITRYKGDASEVVVPAAIDGKPVNVIGRGAFIPKDTELSTDSSNKITTLFMKNGWAFEGHWQKEQYRGNLTSITLPSTITHIEAFAFIGNSLTSVHLPAGLKWIGTGAFAENKLTQVSLPSSLTMIDNGAFKNNLLTSVVIPKGITEIRRGVFRGNQLTSVTLPAGLQSIKRSAFKDNQLTQINLPSSLKKIEEEAFVSNRLSTLDLPAGLETIEVYAFSDNPLTNLFVPDSVTTAGNDRWGIAEGSSKNHLTTSLPGHLKGKYTEIRRSSVDTYIYRD